MYFSTEAANQGQDKTADDDDFYPETFGNLIIAHRHFGEVDMEPNIGIARRNGRIGSQPVHVMQFSQISDSSSLLMKRLRRVRDLSHPNLLRCFYVSESSSKM